MTDIQSFQAANSNIYPVAQTIAVDQVGSIIVSPPMDDGLGTGTFVRSIQIFGAPNGTNGPPVFTLLLKSTTSANLDISTPTLTF
jgi:hypothetical protein